MIKRTLFAVCLATLVTSVAAGDPLIPTVPQIADCSADAVAGPSTSHFSNLNVTCSDVTAFLGAADVVSEWQWLHGYSHVAFGDRTGRLTLIDGTELRWMIRPGGLGYLAFPDGRRAYLVGCCRKPPSHEAMAKTPNR